MNDHHWWRWWLHRILYAILHNFHFSWGYKNNSVVPKIRHTNVEQVSKQWDIHWFHTCKSRNAVFNSGPSLRSPTGPPNQTISSRHCFILLNTLVPDIANDCMCCSYWAEWDITSWENVFKIQNYGFPYCRWLIWTMFWNIKHQNTIYPNRPIHPKCISSSAVSVIKQPNPKHIDDVYWSDPSNCVIFSSSLCLPFSVNLSPFLLFPPPPQLSFLSLSRRRLATESVLRQIDVLWIGYPVCYSKCWYTAFPTPSSICCSSTAPIDK